MGLFDGLGEFGLNLDSNELFEDEKKKGDTAQKQAVEKTPEEKEIELLFDKKYNCPNCYEDFNARVVRAGKAKLASSDYDLRPKYENIDCDKYGVLMCPKCGYAALTRYFNSCTPPQLKLIKERISANFKPADKEPLMYTYDEAISRYKMALANAMVKRARASEKAYICLKTGWMYRAKAETLADQPENAVLLKELKNNEMECMRTAYDGFVSARSTEGYPMCGMDEQTVDYIIAALAVKIGKLDVAAKMTAGLLGDLKTSKRMKERALDLKELLLAEKKKQEKA